MEAALVMPKLVTLVQEKYKLRKRIKEDITSIYTELGMIVSAIEDYSRSSRSKDLGAVPRSWIEEVRDLAHEIEDCVDRFLYDQAAHGRLWRAPARFASEIRALREKSKQVYERMGRYTGGGDGQWPTSAGASTSSAPADPLVLEADLVGMAEPRRELLELVQDPVEKLKVISVVGFGGLGKTLLARQIYESDVAKQFRPRVWVRAADKGAEEVLMEVLMEIRKQTGTQQGDASDVEVEQLSKHLREHLHNKRYFIVIDDMRTEQWGTIGPAFPADNGVSSRIMVTTSLHTIANACSSESGYVYKMSTLDAKCSEDLFLNSACWKERSPNMESGSAALLKKCDGLPLALVSVGQFLRRKGSLTGTTCQDLCAKLGYHLERDETLSRMHRVLTHNYTCLSGHAAKACLLYLGMFPSNHRIRRKTLIRRWLAEGLVVTQPRCSALDVAVENFEALIDRNIIQPIDVSNNEEVKTCQPPGMMLEFIVHKSVSEKFITLFCDKTSLPRYARRLSVHHNSATSVSPDNDLSLVRSLTVFGEAGQDILDFRKYQLLRVLDLEECNDLTDRHLKGICNLLLLRYLSLGGTITTLPRKISKLKFLETLDVRRTMVEVLLPIEVIVLPNLIHLFGKFKLLGEVSSKIQNFFVSGESNLQALAGFVTNENQGLLQLMGHMKKLKKVKIWCESTGDSNDLTDLSRAIEEYIQDGTRTTDARSLSLDFEKCSKDFMQFSLPEDCYLSSLKLHGELHKMPPFVTSLCDLRELCLSSTNLSGDLLTVLSNLRCLLFLKLAADRLENFVITDGAFPRLRRLCFVVQSSTLPEICDGALPQLLSLHLLYKDLDGLHAIKIECIKRLMEVKIDCKVKAETRKTWEDAAKKHPNRPKILFMEKVHPMEVRPTENSVVPERLEMHLAQSGKEEVHEEDTKQQEEVPTEMHLARVLPFLQGGMEAPISASLGAMVSLLGKLDVLLAPEYRLPKEAKDGIQLLRGDLQEIATSLVDLSEAEDPPLTARCWMKDVRELSYDMEDYVDELLHSGADAKAGTVRRGGRFKIGRVGRFKIGRFPSTLKRQPLITNRVSEFRSHVEEAIQRHESYNLGDCISRRRHLSVGRMLPTEYTETDDLFDGPRNELLKWLTNEEEQQLKVVSIVGSGGLGKTTLARKLYHKLGGRFDCRAFLHTSQKPDMKRLLGGMLSQLRHHHQPPDACEVPELIHAIRTHLLDKRYLIVIDDLWATSLWNSISHAFPECNHRSRIITTTQIEEVALTCCSYHKEYIFKMKRLNMDQSSELFFKRVFGSEDDCPQQFRRISLEIIKRCDGLPLAIISIASLLASQPVLLMEQWLYIASNLKISTSEGMRQVLNLSYDNLPNYLKTCLLYLNTYPEDYTILKDDLVKQWVAEGFINAIEGQDVEEVAGSYFDELVNRRMIQPMDTNYKHEVFMVHGMLLDLIAHKSTEDNFSTAVDYSQNTIRLCDKVRRLSFHFGSAKYAKAPTSIGLSQVRSLAFFGLFKSMPPITEFNLLRVLILQIWGDCGGTSVDLTRICELHQLRYLQIACDVSIEIPALMQRLQCLETVEIYARLTTVPLDIVHLPRLLHLCLPGETNLLGSVGHMTSLRRLGYLDLICNSVDTMQSLGELTNLRNLHLACCTVPSDHLERNMQCLSSILGKLSNLKSLTLVSTSSRANILVPCHGLSFVSPVPCLLQRLELLQRICIFSSLPKWIGELGELCTLKIAVRELRRNDVDTLKRLSTLTILSLCVKEAPLQRITFHSMEFPVLRYFKFRCWEACLTFEEGAMPNLRRLKLGFNAHGAGQHSRMPTGLENLLSLEELTARIGDRGATESDRRAAESALTTMIPGVNIFWVYCIFNLNESISRRTQEEGSRILEEHGILEIEPEQEYGIAQRDEKQKYCMDEEGDTR